MYEKVDDLSQKFHVILAHFATLIVIQFLPIEEVLIFKLS